MPKQPKKKKSTRPKTRSAAPARKRAGKTQPSARSNSSLASTSHKLTVPAEGGAIEILARGVLRQGTRILLCQNVKHGYYYLPGGHVEFSESAERALRREFQEELGLDVRVGPLLMIDETSWRKAPTADKRLHHELNLVFHVELARGGDGGNGGNSNHSAPPKSLEKHLNFAWIELAAIPELDVRPLTAKAFIAAGAGENRPECTAEWVSAMLPDMA